MKTLADLIAWAKSTQQELMFLRRQSQRTPKYPAGGRGGCCQARWELWIQATGMLVSGSFDLGITYKEEGESKTGIVTIPHDATAEDLKTLIHDATGLSVNGGGGPLEWRSIVFRVAGATDINISSNNLGAGRPYLMYLYKASELEVEE